MIGCLVNNLSADTRLRVSDLLKMADLHAGLVDNPYHYSFKLCANALNKQSDSVYSSYLNVSTSDEFHCDQCDRSFKNGSQLNAHIKEHVVCNTNGCQFTAHPKIISAHIRMQHHSGIFNKIKKLDNPDEVQKWLAERKRKYPTQSNISKQAKLDTEKRKRGELIEPKKERFNKNFNSRVGKRKRKQRNKKHPEENKSNPTVEEVLSREQKTKRNGNLLEFGGTSSICADVDDFEGTKQFYISDEDEYGMNENKTSDDMHPMNKSLALLMASYDSGEESEVGNAVASSISLAIPTKPVSNPLVESDDGEAPDEIKNLCSTSDMATVDLKRFPKHLNKGIKRSFKNNGNTAFMGKKRKPTLLQKLLEKQIVHEKNAILDCIHYIIQNNFLNQTEEPCTIIATDIANPQPAVSFKNISKVEKIKQNKRHFLLQGLLKDEIIKEQNMVLQCIRHVTKNNFFQEINKSFGAVD